MKTKNFALFFVGTVFGCVMGFVVLFSIALFSSPLDIKSITSTSVPRQRVTLIASESPQFIQPTNTPRPTYTSQPTSTSDPSIVYPGTYIVGADILPGLYQGNAGSDVFDSCYWERLSSLDGELGSILANDNSMNQFYVQILETDYAFRTACVLRKVK